MKPPETTIMKQANSRIATRAALLTLCAATLSACVSIPNAPTVAVMPAPNKPFEVFQQEEFACRDYAQRMVGVNATDAAAQNVVGGAMVGATIGALAGAALGGRHSSGSTAVFGAAVGSSMGASSGAYVGYEVQRRYNIAYTQCMYAKGNQVQGYASRSYPAPPPPPAQN
jgi:uncharacterized protein YcfJ